MSANHGAEWPRYIHRIEWSCALCGDKAGKFSSEEHLVRHLTQNQAENHPPTLGAIEVSKIKSRGKIASPVPANHCPLCGPPPWHEPGKTSKVADVLSGKHEDLHQHFADHLQHLALLSISWWDEDIGAAVDSPHSGYGSTDAIGLNSEIDDQPLASTLLHLEDADLARLRKDQTEMESQYQEHRDKLAEQQKQLWGQLQPNLDIVALVRCQELWNQTICDSEADQDALIELEALHEQVRREAETVMPQEKRLDMISGHPVEPRYSNPDEISELWKTQGLSHSASTGHDPTIGHVVKGVLNLFRRSTQPITSAHSIDPKYELLVTVLPIFAALAEIHRSRLEATDESKVQVLMTFYFRFKVLAYVLSSELQRWHDFEWLQRFLLYKNKDEVQRTLSGILNELEALFLSWKGEKAIICESLGLQRKEGESYPKLSALRRILPENDILNESFITALDSIIKIDSSRSSKRKQLLDSLESAISSLDDLHPFPIEYSSSSPMDFAQYPLQHMKGFMRTLFEVLSKNWPCQCFGASHSPQCPAAHISSKIRLDLTQYQRFEPVPSLDQSFSKSRGLFRVLFPTDALHDHWQVTEIIIHSRE